MRSKTKYFKGQRFGRLTILSLDHIDSKQRKFFKCQCDCGNRKIIQGSLMSSGNTKSCGCLSSEIKKSKLLPDNLGVIRQIILGYKRHAKRRGFEFYLTEKQVIKLISDNCYYCGLPPSNFKITKNHPGFYYSGIDRIDSNEDYSFDNSVPCCEQCNKAKMALTRDEFLVWIQRVYNHSLK